MTSVSSAHEPRQEDSQLARNALVAVRTALAARGDGGESIHLSVGNDSESIMVPRVAMDMLVQVLANLAAGQGVTLVPAHAELTTQQAADLLNVSRPFLIKLLDENEISYRTVGTHRRIQASSLMEYKARDDAQRRKTADELSAMTRALKFD